MIVVQLANAQGLGKPRMLSPLRHLRDCQAAGHLLPMTIQWYDLRRSLSAAQNRMIAERRSLVIPCRLTLNLVRLLWRPPGPAVAQSRTPQEFLARAPRAGNRAEIGGELSLPSPFSFHSVCIPSLIEVYV